MRQSHTFCTIQIQAGTGASNGVYTLGIFVVTWSVGVCDADVLGGGGGVVVGGGGGGLGAFVDVGGGGGGGTLDEAGDGGGATPLHL
jgi:hypothetical protein